MADAALRCGHVLRHPLAVSVGIRFLEVSFKKFQDTVETKAFFLFGFCAQRLTIFRIGASGWRIAVEQHVLDSLWEFVERCIEIEAVGICGKFESAFQDCGSRARAQAAIKKRTAEIMENLCRVKIVFRAEAIARGAGAVRRIEAERSRL